MKSRRITGVFLALIYAVIFFTYTIQQCQKNMFNSYAITRYGDVLYEMKNGKLVVYANDQNGSSITIPDKISNQYVYGLGSYAFANCSKLSNITLSQHLESIGVCAFYQCDALKSIAFPSSLKIVDNSAFYDCSYLENVQFSNGIETIGNSSFGYCKRLKSFTLPDSIKKINDFIFNTKRNE